MKIFSIYAPPYGDWIVRAQDVDRAICVVRNHMIFSMQISFEEASACEFSTQEITNFIDDQEHVVLSNLDKIKYLRALSPNNLGLSEARDLLVACDWDFTKARLMLVGGDYA